MRATGVRGRGGFDRTREPYHADQEQEEQRRHVEDVVGRKHEGLLVDEAIHHRVALVGAHATRLQSRQRLCRCRVVLADALDELLVMQGGATIPPCRDDRRPERAGGDPREVEESRRRRDSLRGGSRKTERDEWYEE